MLTKLLIANRGEIAVRVIRTARELGYRTVAVYSEADANALHVQEADEAVLIGPAQVSASYLNVAAVLEAARKTGADAIHPGYGFLSENADFATACQNAGLTFVGPPAQAIELMGSKRRSKIAMQKAGVPVVPGFEGDRANDEELVAAAGTIGYPLMIKASAGGGGRGMRLVHEASQLKAEIQRARSEARNAFGDDELILERAVIEPRHVEIQVFADKHGNAIYLGERDCSIQRRHQKVVEEAPSPFVTPELRKAMGEAAVKAALACQYEGAGTVEFLVDKDRNFYFLEMNTRLQVEHPVTELVTGQDLVAWQLNVAEGRPLPLSQEEVRLDGHAIEVRLYAEDPANGFLPQTGLLHCFEPAPVPGVRYDTGVRSGDIVTSHYDPMLAKVVAWGPTRDDARRRLLRALEDTLIAGVITNRHFLSRIIAHEAFGAGEATTAFLEQAFADDPSLHPAVASSSDIALAATVFALGNGVAGGWSNSLTTALPLSLQLGDERLQVQVRRAGDEVTIEQTGDTRTLIVKMLDHRSLCYVDNDVRLTCQYQQVDNHLYLQSSGRALHLMDVTHQPPGDKAGAGSGRLQAAMDGNIVDVLVSPGDSVAKGDTLVVLEAMKMEHPVKADRDGQVARINVATGDQVRRQQLLVELSAEDGDTGPAQQKEAHA
ncbi:acetyl/propionyl/methylcrotonyl-CoA carboxylase subunit alpha [Marinobacter salicampi]|uniref:acetyl/propionyl/methylcrotonyl-CoA carboxylase subunit alpha n=1 Tax=Marinobacter salicampi TaxID=435907 RepID=UPI00140BDB42|nr:acetyl/propionyl/methylcrotonyl-CoA carboxylase subunit alpha [Marinobacter salicampi]